MNVTMKVNTMGFALGLTALFGAIIFLEGTSWDIQWHSYIGRDRTLISCPSFPSFP